MALAKEALADLGADRFDVLVNTSGTSLHKTIEAMTEDDLDKGYNVHSKSVFLRTQQFLPRRAEPA